MKDQFAQGTPANWLRIVAWKHSPCQRRAGISPGPAVSSVSAPPGFHSLVLYLYLVSPCSVLKSVSPFLSHVLSTSLPDQVKIPERSYYCLLSLQHSRQMVGCMLCSFASSRCCSKVPSKVRSFLPPYLSLHPLYHSSPPLRHLFWTTV